MFSCVCCDKCGGADSPNLEAVRARTAVHVWFGRACLRERVNVRECVCVCCAVLLATPSVQDVKFPNDILNLNITKNIHIEPPPEHCFVSAKTTQKREIYGAFEEHDY